MAGSWHCNVAAGCWPQSLDGIREAFLDILGAVLRVYSYLYHFLLSLFLFLISIVVLIGGKNDLQLPMLPWEGASLVHWVLGLGLTGLLVTLLAVTGFFRFAFPFWCLFVVILMARGFFLSSFYYSGGSDQFRGAVWLFIGAAGAFLSSLMLFKPKRVRR